MILNNKKGDKMKIVILNSKKGDKTPEEAGLRSVYPKEPTLFQDVISSELLQAWENFKLGFWFVFFRL